MALAVEREIFPMSASRRFVDLTSRNADVFQQVVRHVPHRLHSLPSPPPAVKPAEETSVALFVTRPMCWPFQQLLRTFGHHLCPTC